MAPGEKADFRESRTVCPGQGKHLCFDVSEDKDRDRDSQAALSGPGPDLDDSSEPFDWHSYTELLRPYELFTGPNRVERHDGDQLPDPADPFAPQDCESFVPHPYARDQSRRDITETRPQMRVRPAYDALGRWVFIKVVKTNSAELEICQYLKRQHDVQRDKRDHTIPILDIIHAAEWTFIVTPEWGTTQPPYNVGEQLECLRQLLEGVVYLHEHCIAHRDLSPGNILLSFGGRRGPWGKPFMSTFPARYGLLDFGLSVQFPQDVPHEERLITGWGFTPGFQAPEISDTVPYDPFKVDMYALGYCILWDMRQYKLLSPVTAVVIAMCPDFVKLLGDMTERCPDCRPTASEALARLEELISRTPDWIMRLPGGDYDAGANAHRLWRSRVLRHYGDIG